MIQQSRITPWLAVQADRNPHGQAIISDEKKLTFGELLTEASRMAVFLQKQGITAGSHVAFACPNSVSAVILIHALLLLKAVIVPLHIRSTNKDILRQITFADCTHLILSNDVFLNPDIENLNIIHFNDFVQDDTDITNLLSGPQLSDTLLLMFTSGTSGDPKCVELSYRNVFYNALATKIRLRITDNDSWLLSLPLYHIGGFSIIIRAVVFGIPVIISPKPDTDNVIEAIGKYNPSIISLVPTVMQRILEKGMMPNSRHNAVLLGGGVIADSLLEQGSEKGWNIAATYGTTETSSQIATLIPDNKNYKNSVGQPMPFTRVRIIDEKGKETEQGQEGEIAVSTPSLMKGYYKRKDISSNAIRYDWYFTGDYGYKSSDGYLYVVSRRIDLIVSGGENINPYEIEELLIGCPGIDDVCIIPQSDPDWGEIVAAVVVTGDNILTLDNIKNYLTGKIASFKIPKKLYLFDSIPYTDIGKKNRAEVLNKISSLQTGK
jgi:o-succinylbenzoate---CoA ligase